MATGSNFKVRYKIVDEALLVNSESERNLSLSIQLGLNGFSFSILDLDKNKYLALQSYLILKSISPEELLSLIEKTLKEEQIKFPDFRQKDLTFVNNKSTLVPAALYSKDENETFLKFNVMLKGSEIFLADKLKNTEAINVYAVEKELYDWAVSWVSPEKLFHYSSLLVTNVVRSYKNRSGEMVVFMHIGDLGFDLIVLDGERLIFSNFFDCQNDEDYVYYLLFVCEQLKLNPEKLRLILAGSIDPNAVLVSVLRKYVTELHFAERNENCLYSYLFNDQPDHYFYALLNQHAAVNSMR
jgi:hypothetical protein